MDLTILERNPINSLNQITYANSLVHLRKETTSSSLTIYLWVWSGSLNKTLGSADHILVKEKVSLSDTYITFEISELLTPLLNPELGYNSIELPAVSGQAVFWQAKIVDKLGVLVENTGTKVATLGYELTDLPNDTVNKWYNSRVNNYFSQSFNLTLSQSVATTSNIIKTEPITIPNGWSRCSLDPCLIIFINKFGLWETFTPNGKLFSQIKTQSETQNRAFRDMSRVNNNYAHFKDKRNLEAMQTFVINTGALDETMNETIKQIIFSPKVYFIKFKGDLIFPEMVGITIDNTFISIDDTITTIDSATATLSDVGKYKTHQQIPVIVSNQDFTEKTRVNDKNKIDYVLNLEQTRNMIL